MNVEKKPAMVRGTRRGALGATLAIAAAGALIAPPAFAAPVVGVSASPQSGTPFTVTATGLDAGYYRAILTTTAGDPINQAEAGTCLTAQAVAAGATFSCTLREDSAGTYTAKVVADATGAVQASQPVTILSTTATTIAPTALDNAGTADTVTVTRQTGVVWKVDTDTVSFAPGATTATVAVTDGAAVVTAAAESGYALPEGARTSWSYRFSTTSAALTPVTPPAEGTATAPKYTDRPGTTQDTVTVTRTAGIDWYVNGTKVDIAAGATTATVYTTQAANTTVEARAVDGHVFPGSLDVHWYTPEFTDLKADPPVTRLAGANRMDTAVAISKKYWDTAGTVYVANGLRYADALTAGPAAARDGGPLLLTMQDSVPSNVLDELRRLNPARIHIVGGTSVVSTGVEATLNTVAPVTRLAGGTRYATSAAVSSKWADAAGGTVHLALGENFPDALSGGSGAASAKGALLLSQRTGLTQPTTDALKRIKPARIVLVGGADVLTEAVRLEAADAVPGATVVRYAGADRYATSAAVATGAGTASATDTVMFLATGLNFPDALAGVPAADKVGAPLFLSQPTCLPTSVKTVVDTMTAVESQVRLGSEGVLGSFSLTTTCAS